MPGPVGADTDIPGGAGIQAPTRVAQDAARPGPTGHQRGGRKDGNGTATARREDDDSQDKTTMPLGRGTTPASAVVVGPA